MDHPRSASATSDKQRSPSLSGTLKSRLAGENVSISGTILGHDFTSCTIKIEQLGHEIARIDVESNENFIQFDFSLPCAPLKLNSSFYRNLQFKIISNGDHFIGDFDRSDYHLDIDEINEHNFHIIIQSPATRIKDNSMLSFFASAFLDQHIRQFTLASPAMCVIGYRYLEQNKLSELGSLIDHCKILFEGRHDLNERFSYRWFVSNRLLAGYFYLIVGDIERCRNAFRDIVSSHKYLFHTPQMATNTLKAIFILGYIEEHFESGAGVEVWLRSNVIIRQASIRWEYENYYSYSELAQSMLLARECLSSAAAFDQFPESRNRNRDFAAPAAIGIDFSLLGFPANQYDFRGRLIELMSRNQSVVGSAAGV